MRKRLFIILLLFVFIFNLTRVNAVTLQSLNKISNNILIMEKQSYLITNTYDETIEDKDDNSIYNPSTGNINTILFGLIFIVFCMAIFTYISFYYNKN